ncbi:hypothetical protein CYPRO_1102 [Cyclonatronum proteinivorum]|uniref:Uncharacterized protein n=1 Tax=Cyclonatronum proteinivorum TaxID=1457365 RepID=A0A345UIR5_9BACT|nr:hypothetical protein [Cyclonatronum proteinivorum]AXJ00367.1 hypothetical protein CYPRO_1102 [Cyclonatronum proteinivorum]
MSPGATPKIYVAGFSFTAKDVDQGTFQIITKETTQHRAEKKFIKKIRAWSEAFPERRPVTVFILDIAEIPANPDLETVLFFEEKVSYDGDMQRTAFTALPLREPGVETYALSMPAEPVLFWESDPP